MGLSQLKMVIRPMYSSPPIHGALLVDRILGDSAAFDAWKSELKAMAERILEVRGLLRTGLEAKGTPGTWNHITDQIGMFFLHRPDGGSVRASHLGAPHLPPEVGPDLACGPEQGQHAVHGRLRGRGGPFLPSVRMSA